MSSSKSIIRTEKDLRADFRSALRQGTRAALGVAISSVLTSQGLYYMVISVTVAGHGVYEAHKATKIVTEYMRQQGFRIRKRDMLSGFLIGSVQKAVMTTVFLGHDEFVMLVVDCGLSQSAISAEFNLLTAGGHGLLHNPDGSIMVNGERQVLVDRGPLGNVNKWYNMPVDALKDFCGIKEGHLETMADVAGNLVVGGVAGAIEYVTNRAGHAGRKVADRVTRR